MKKKNNNKFVYPRHAYTVQSVVVPKNIEKIV